MLLLLLSTLPLPAMMAPMSLKCTQRGDAVTVTSAVFREDDVVTECA
jgi:hypothetical protein